MRQFVAAFALMAVAAVVAATMLVDAARPKWHQLEGYTFERFVKDFGKVYQNGAEFEMRKRVFVAKVAAIRKHNADATKTWKRGVNMFTDMTAAEWKRYNAFKKSPHRVAPTKVFAGTDAQVPRSVDWRDKTDPAVITPVKHQGSCGCCWANSATESMEAYHAFQTGKLVSLSFQQITSCTPQPLSYGCDGGDYQMAWISINQSGVPLNEEACYPFSNFFFPTSGPAQTAPCYNISSKFPNKHPYSWFAMLPQVGIDGFVSVSVNNASAAKIALAQAGPQSISVAAGNWQDYETGIFQNDPANGQDNEWQIDHAVQMIGYGVDTVEKDGQRVEMGYWWVRNSWSTEWGIDGYIKLARPDVEPCSPPEYGPVCGTSGCLSDLQYPITKHVAPLPF
jgi:cathepsin L